MSKTIKHQTKLSWHGARVYHPRRGSGTILELPDGEEVVEWDIEVPPDCELDKVIGHDLIPMFTCEMCGRELLAGEEAPCKETICAECVGCTLSEVDVTFRHGLRKITLEEWLQPNGHGANGCKNKVK